MQAKRSHAVMQLNTSKHALPVRQQHMIVMVVIMVMVVMLVVTVMAITMAMTFEAT